MNPRVIIAYVAVSQGVRTAEFLSRFRLTFDAHPPGYPCEVICVCNGGPLSEEDGLWLRQEWKCFPRKNDPGWDIGAYIDVANKFECDVQVCLGESVYFHREGWLRRIVEAFENNGPGMYGLFASNLSGPHLNTTAFAIDPKLLRSSEMPRSREERHRWEHGTSPFWKRIEGLGMPVKVVTFNGEFGPAVWRASSDGFWSGDQKDCLAWCVHTDRWANADLETKRRWTLNADVGLRQ